MSQPDDKPRPVEKTDAEWRAQLDPTQYQVARHAATERAFSGKYWDHWTPGQYNCVGCGIPLFASDTKFDSGTGWPSFYQPLHKAVGQSSDRSLLMARTEVHCSRCGGHLGHVFDDGPKPTGLRYCMNGVAMTFKASDAVAARPTP